MVAARSILFSVVRFTDFISHPCHPSDESLGYFQSSAKRGLSRITFCAKLSEPVEQSQRIDYLKALRTEIAALMAVKCRMFHERIIRAAGSNLPVVCRVPERSYQRIGLCDPETRARQLGCGHTMSRYRLEKAIAELDPENVSAAEKTLLGSELNYLVNEIHLLDHKKGEAEKALAIALEEVYEEGGAASANDERLRFAENQITQIEQLHDEYVARIGALRDRVLAQIDNLIAQISVTASRIDPNAVNPRI
jgi:hypothetical protein